MDDVILREVNSIFATLQAKPWREHSPALLSSAQGKLASYLSNVISMAVDAQYEFELKELHASQYESDRYLAYRESGKSLEESKHNARLDSVKRHEDALMAKKVHLDLRGIVDAMKNLSVACSTSLKHYEVERINTSHV